MIGALISLMIKAVVGCLLSLLFMCDHTGEFVAGRLDFSARTVFIVLVCCLYERIVSFLCVWLVWRSGSTFHVGLNGLQMISADLI